MKRISLITCVLFVLLSFSVFFMPTAVPENNLDWPLDNIITLHDGDNPFDVTINNSFICAYTAKTSALYSIDAPIYIQLYNEYFEEIWSGFQNTFTFEEGSTYYLKFIANNFYDSVLNISINAQNTSGVCGTNLTWSYDGDGILTISGYGKMYDYDNYTNLPPWRKFDNRISKIVINNGVETIGNYAFWPCGNGNLEIEIPNSVITIGDYAFECTTIEKIDIPASVTNIGLSFGNCFNLKCINVSKDNENYMSIDGVLYDKTCTQLIKCPDRKTGSFSIPDGVEYILEYSLYSDISQLLIPSSVKYIQGFPFNLPNLEVLNVAEENPYYKSKDNMLYDNKNKLIICAKQIEGNVDIPNVITEIGNDAFGGCKKITGIKFPDGLTTIGSWAITNCSGLREIKIPGSVRQIKNNAFTNCTNIKNAILQDGIVTIRDEAFTYNENLESIVIPKSVKNIGRGIFYGCNKITIYCERESKAEEYAILNNIKYKYIEDCEHEDYRYEIEAATLTENGSINTICLHCGNQIQSKTINSNAILSLPANLKFVDEESFIGISAQQVVIYNGVKTIEESAFKNCSNLMLVIIPDSVTSIADNAFEGCADVVLMCSENSPARELGLTCVTP